jgi:fucose permease
MAVLFCNGLLYSTWGVSVPLLKQKFDLSEGVIAIAMAVISIGGIVTMGLAGAWIAKTGSGRASVQTGLLMCLSAAPILLIPSYPALLALLFVYGIATAANDVAANAQGSYLEGVSKQSLIGSLHASFSVGGLVGALVASGWGRTGFAADANFYVLALLAGLAIAAASVFLKSEPSAEGPEQTRGAGQPQQDDTRLRHRLRLFGALAFCALVVEGAFYDWAAVYMREVVKAPPSWVGFGYAAFAVGMTLSRLAGDKVRDRYAHQQVIAGSGLVCVAGLAVILSVPGPIVVVAGFFVTGVGLANFIPMLFSSAGRLARSTGRSASEGLAVTTRMGYVGLLAGPLLIGPVAEHIGLRLSMVSLAAFVAATCAGWLLLSRATHGAPWSLTAQGPARTHQLNH